jgi:hypothetical protein
MMNNHTATWLKTIATSALLSLFVSLLAIGNHSNTSTKGYFKSAPKSSYVKISDTETQQPVDTPQAIVEPVVAPENVIVQALPEEETLKSRLNRVVTTNLKKVFTIAKNFGHPETMQAILLQESGGGVANPVGNLASPVGKRSYGIMQVQVIAARSILTRYPEIFAKYFPDRMYSSVSDEEVISLLIANDEANIHIASQHFTLYLALSKGDWHKAVAAYNMGIGNANKRSNHSEYPYVRDVKTRLQSVIRPFNKANNLTLTVSS